jgi:hypothetical protein
MKGQSAIEFVVLTSVMFLFFGITIITIEKTLVDTTRDTQQLTLDELQRAINHEISTAASMPAGYEHTFTLPETIQGIQYSMAVQTEAPPLKDAIIVTVGADQRVFYLPNNFVGSLQPGTNEIHRTTNSIKANTGLIAHWPYNETGGGGGFLIVGAPAVVAIDRATGRYNGTVNNVGWTVPSPVYPTSADFSPVGGFESFGSIGGASITSAFPTQLYGTPSWSYAAWIRSDVDNTGTEAIQQVFSIGAGEAYSTAVLYIQNDGVAVTGFVDGDGISSGENTFNMVPYDNQWVHVTTTYDNTTHVLSTYVNKQLVAQKIVPRTGIDTFSHTGDDEIRVGTPQMLTFPPSEALHGQVSDLRIYNHALDTDEIATLP